LIQFPIWIGSIACGGIPSGILFKLNAPEIIEIIVFIIGMIFGGVYLNKWLQPVATIWYLSVFCNTSVSYKEAEELGFLFDGSLNGKWYPFEDLENIPEEYRKRILYEFAEKLMGYRFKTNPYKKQSKNTYSQRSYSNREDQAYTDSNRSDYKNKNARDGFNDNYLEACSVMGLDTNFTKEELKNKYRELMKQYHPDLFANSNQEIKNIAEVKTREINIAYEYLVNYSG
jgi:hypothetical protein